MKWPRPSQPLVFSLSTVALINELADGTSCAARY
jgi:hypothetical protein